MDNTETPNEGSSKGKAVAGVGIGGLIALVIIMKIISVAIRSANNESPPDNSPSRHVGTFTPTTGANPIVDPRKSSNEPKAKRSLDDLIREVESIRPLVEKLDAAEEEIYEQFQNLLNDPDNETIDAWAAFGRMALLDEDNDNCALASLGLRRHDPKLTGIAGMRELVAKLEAKAGKETLLKIRLKREDFLREHALVAKGQGDPFMLAMMYREGQVVLYNHAKHRQLIKQAAAEGDLRAQNLLTAYFYGDSEDSEDVFNMRLKLIDLCDGIVSRRNMLQIAQAYLNGNGTQKNPEKAIEWFEKGIALGYEEFRTELALAYRRGDSIPKDGAKALQLYVQSATQARNTNSMMQLDFMLHDGEGVKKDEAGAFDWLRQAAQMGDEAAANDLGLKYSKGSGVAKDLVQARLWHRRSALMGNSVGMANYGHVLAQGEGGPQDDAQALKWLRAAASHGEPFALNWIGVFHANGRGGLNIDMQRAFAHYLRAAELGHATAQYNVGYCYDLGEGVEKDYKKAIGWLRKAAEQDELNALNFLGAYLEFGLASEPDFKAAVENYQKAADKEFPYAMKHLGRCYLRGIGVEVDLIKARHWLEKAHRLEVPETEALLKELEALKKPLKESE